MIGLSRLALAGVFVWGAFVQGASAATQSVDYGNLNASATVATPLNSGDTLFLNTFTTEIGALSETTTFTLGPDVGSLVGRAVWEVGGINEPFLKDVEIKIFDSSSTLVADDSFEGLFAGFAHSTMQTPPVPPGGSPVSLAPGTYTLVATGTGVRDSSLDISLTFANAIPEPTGIAMLIAGLVAVGALSQRKRT